MRSRSHLFTPAVLLLLAWGVFAFGAVYTWGHVPLLIFSLTVSALGFLAARGTPAAGLAAYRPLALSLAVLLAAAVIQVVPLPSSAIAAVSPARDDVDYPKLHALRMMRDQDAAAPAAPPRTLSIAPSRTWLGIALLTGLSALLLGAAAGFSAVRPTSVVRGVMVIGVLAAMAQLIQRALTGGSAKLVYGLFPPLNYFEPSAPFLNRNHTAGFLVMALSVSLGYLASTVDTGWRRVRPEWRERIVWFGTRDGSQALLAAMAVMIMATAVVATGSRGGVVMLGLTLLSFGVLVIRRPGSRGAKAILLVAAALTIAAGANVGGISSVLDRFAGRTREQGVPRTVIWQSALAQARDFPVTGTGLNTFNVASLHYQDLFEPRRATRDVEAHNDYLQLASEGGLLLGLPALAAIASLVLLIRRRFREGRDDTRLYWLRAGAVVGMLAIAAQALVEFTLQMPGAAVMFVLLAAIAMHKVPGGGARTAETQAS